MAIILAEPSAPAGSDWSSPATWIGGIVPGPGDIAVANTRDISIWQDASCAEIRNDTTGSATAGGRFRLRPDVTLSANVYAGNVSPTGLACLYYDSVGAATLIGNVVGGSGASSYGARCAGSSSILNIYGNVTGGSVSGAYGLVHGFGVVNLYGNITGGVAAGYYGGAATQQTATTLNLLGNAFPGSSNSGYGVYVANYSIVRIVGDVFAQTLNNIASGLYLGTGVADAIVYGTVYGTAYGPGSTGLLPATHGATNASTGTLKVYRTVMGEKGMPAISGPFTYINSRSAQHIVRATGSLTAVALKDVLGWTPDPSDVLAGTVYEGRTGVWTPSVGQISMAGNF